MLYGAMHTVCWPHSLCIAITALVAVASCGENAKQASLGESTAGAGGAGGAAGAAGAGGAASANSGGERPTTWHVARAFVRDPEGRAVIMRGANIANRHKRPPYFGFHEAADYRVLRDEWGMNAIRFLLSWSAIEPERDVYDAAYLDEVAKRVEWARDAGLLVVLDMHQDVYGEGFGGDGAPRWTCDEARYEDFVRRSPWFINYMDENVQACFDAFWGSESLQAHYVEAWRRVAERVSDNSAVIGFDVINEPHWGSIPATEFESSALTPFYQRVVEGVRAVAPEWIAFLEPSASRNLGVPTKLTTFAFDNVVYAPHSYNAAAEAGNGFDPTMRVALIDNIEALSAEARTLNAAFWIGEYGGRADHPGITEYMDAQYDGAAAVGASTMYWAYDRDESYGLLQPDGSEKPALLDVLVRPYPKRVAGDDISYNLDESTDTFTATWLPDGTIDAPTVLAVPLRRYPNGYDVECAECTYEAGDGELVIATMAASPADGTVTVTLTPR